MRTIRTIATALAVLALGAAAGRAAVVYNVNGGTYSQNFNWTTTGNSTSEVVVWTSDAATQPFTTVNWVGNSTGWYAGSNAQDSSNIRAGNGNESSNTGGRINNFYHVSGDTDRSFGGRPTGTVPMNLALRLNNQTGVTLTEFTLGYRLEVTYWRANGNQTTANVSYYVGNPTNWRTDAFTAAPTLNLTTVYGGNLSANNTNVDGNAAGNYTTVNATITGVNWTNGSDLWIRWYFPTGTNLPNVGLDDVSFSAIPEPGSVGLALLGGAALLIRRLRRRA